MAHIAFYRGAIPVKWARPWSQLRLGLGNLLIGEPLIFEIYCQIARTDGRDSALAYLLRLKSLKSTRIIPPSDSDDISFLSGDLNLKHSRYSLSFVDLHNLAIVKKHKATLYTTDHKLRDAARDENCYVSYLPKESLVV